MKKLRCYLGLHLNTRTEPFMGIFGKQVGVCVVCDDCDWIIEIITDKKHYHLTNLVPLYIGVVLGAVIVSAYLRAVLL